MKPISLLTICALSLSLILVSCKGNQKKDNQGNEVQTEASSGAALKIITENVDQYPRDIKIFDNKAVSSRLQEITGDQYEEILKYFETQTPIVTEGGIYKFTGCKEHDCPSFQTIVFYDANTDNFNVLVKQNGSTKVYAEKGKITITQSLRMK